MYSNRPEYTGECQSSYNYNYFDYDYDYYYYNPNWKKLIFQSGILSEVTYTMHIFYLPLAKDAADPQYRK